MLITPLLGYRFSLFHLLGVLALALAWLLPNHHRPWTAFHTDAWMAAVLLVVGIVIIVRHRGSLVVPVVAYLALMLAFAPWVHWFLGMVYFPGDAWVNSLYLLAFSLCVVVGALWRRLDLHEALDFLAMAIAAAAVVSVAVQLYQWLGMTHDDAVTDIWAMYLAGHARPYANLGQPNQLATLLIWGICSVAWLCHRGQIRGFWAAVAVMLLIFGLVLTESRTGLVSMTALVFLVAGWHRFRRIEKFLWPTVAVYCSYLVLFFSLGFINQILGLPETTSFAVRAGSELRFQAWAMFLRAALEQPWLGYGWGRTAVAQISVLPEVDAAIHGLFSHAHNIFLDIILWVGLPIGLVVCGVVVWEMVSRVMAVRSVAQAIMVCFLVAVGIHALLELPLHYAYFLLPTGFFLGMSAPVHQGKTWLQVRWPWQLASVLCLALALGVTLRDYFRVEVAYNNLRFEVANIGDQHDRTPANVLVLDHLEAMIDLIRYLPDDRVTPERIAHVQAVVETFPSAANAVKFLTVLSLSGHNAEADYWAPRYCAVLEKNKCLYMMDQWRQQVELSRPRRDVE